MRRHYERAWRTIGALALPAAASVVPRRFDELGRGARVLDVGAGRGSVARTLAEHFDEVVSLDLVPTAGGAGPGVVADLDERLPFADRSFDAVVALDVVEHLFDPVQLLSEAQRVLAPGGRLLVETPNARYFRHVGTLLAGSVPRTVDDGSVLAGLPPPHHGHISPWTGAELASTLVALGFERVTWGGFGFDGAWRARLAAFAFGRDARARGLRALATRSERPAVPWRWSRVEIVHLGPLDLAPVAAYEAVGEGEAGVEVAGVRAAMFLPEVADEAACAHVLVTHPAYALRPGALAALRAAFASDPRVAAATGSVADGGGAAGCLLVDVDALSRCGASPDPTRPVAELDCALATIGRRAMRVPYEVAARREVSSPAADVHRSSRP